MYQLYWISITKLDIKLINTLTLTDVCTHYYCPIILEFSWAECKFIIQYVYSIWSYFLIRLMHIF